MENGFSEIEQNAWGGFLGAYSHISRIIEADLLEHSRLTHVEFEVLLRLYWEENHRLRIQDLASRSLLTRSGTSRAITRLEKAGLVKREQASEDRRGAYAILTNEGVARFQSAAQKHMAFVHEKFLGLFNENELQQMAEFWKRLENKP